MFEVVYYSRTGNTKMVAEAIAAELDVTAEDLKLKTEMAKDSFVFLGTGCYFPMPGRVFKKFIKSNDFNGRKVALFGTSGSGNGNEVKALEKMVIARGATVAGKFYCKGRFLGIFNRNNPTQQELILARRFAHDVSQS